MKLSLMTRLNKEITYKIIFYKNFYKYLFLHKPLCDKFKNDTFKIFGLYICRSCFWLYLGFIISTISTISLIKTINYDKYFYIGLVGCIFTLIISYPTIYKNFGRITRDFVRFYDGIFIAAIFVLCFKINILIGFFSILAFVAIRNLYNKKRKSVDICQNCKELLENTTCSGYIKQKEALLKIEEEYSNIMMKRKGIEL